MKIQFIPDIHCHIVVDSLTVEDHPPTRRPDAIAICTKNCDNDE